MVGYISSSWGWDTMDLLIAKIDENGGITNQADLAAIEQVTAFTEVFIFSHGWWTAPERAAAEYTAFQAGLGGCLDALRGALVVPPNSQLLPIGIEWPSMVVVAGGLLADFFEAPSYPDMRRRAELVAKTGVASLIRRVWDHASDSRRLRIHVLGHSMGCRIACLAMETALLADSKPSDPNDLASAPLARILPNVQLNIVLFQGAFDNNAIERVQKYGILSAIDGLRVLVTRSDLDNVLAAYPSDIDANSAMGAAGPTMATFTDHISHFYDQLGVVSVQEGTDHAIVSGRDETFVVADLTALHKTDRAKEPGKWSAIFGNHSDIFTKEVYELTAGFLYAPAPSPSPRASMSGGR